MSEAAEANSDEFHLVVEYDQGLQQAVFQLPENVQQQRRVWILALSITGIHIAVTVAVGINGAMAGLRNIEVYCGLSLLLCFVAWGLFLRNNYLRYRRPFVFPKQEIRLNSEGIAIEGASGMSYFAWCHLRSIIEHLPYLFLKFHSNSFHVVSTSGLAAETSDRLVNFIRKQMATATTPKSLPVHIAQRKQQLGEPLAELPYTWSEEGLLLSAGKTFVEPAQPETTTNFEIPPWIFVLSCGAGFLAAAWYLATQSSNGFYRGVGVPLLIDLAVICLLIVIAHWQWQSQQRKWVREMRPYSLVRLYPDGVWFENQTAWAFSYWDQFVKIGANANCVGFVRVYDVEIIPRSAFADAASLTTFLELARRLRQNYLDRQAEKSSSNPPLDKTDYTNPYATPRIFPE